MNHILNDKNIDSEIDKYTKSISGLGNSIDGIRGIELFTTLKRKTMGSGPYPEVTLFEAANRIMTDLVILYGVRWLLSSDKFPFTAYTVEYGNEDNNDHDLTAYSGKQTLIGEAFNVAQSFYQNKKSSALKKLRENECSPNYVLLLVNSDATPESYKPRLLAGEHILLVDIGEKSARLI